MTPASIDIAIDAIASGSLNRPLQRMVDAAAHVAHTPGALLTARRGNVDIVLAARGIPHGAFDTSLPALPGTRAILGSPRIIPDVARDPLLARHPLAIEGARWKWAVIIPVHIPGVPPSIVLTCGDPRGDVPRPGDYLQRLERLAAVLADEIEMIGEIVALTHSTRRAIAPVPSDFLPLFATPRAEEMAESPTVVTDFLLSTLIPQRRLLRRGTVTYHALARWRSSLKAWQITALRALKRDPPAVFVDRIARELASAARALYGTGTFTSVVAVPCGNSGPGCLAARLATATAATLDVPVCDAFAPLAVKGSSHPRRNARRPAMTALRPIDRPVLLIDDVAASGAHIEEAALILRRTAPAVLPLVWIAD